MALIQHDCFIRRRGRNTRDAREEEGQCEDTVSQQPSASQGVRPQKNQTCLDLELLASRKYIPVV